MGAVRTFDDEDRTELPQLTPLRRTDPPVIGPYRLLGRLGAGAMGRVYLGRSAAGRLVAVKRIRDEYAEEPDFRARFAHEVAAARRVSGVFTAAVVAADADAEVPWLATAYVPAPSLSRLVETCGPLPVPAVRWLAAGCAEALESIHSTGLVHRDLKPSNVLVSLDGPQVIDFGVARAVERVQLTATREALGTPAYMAPEQAREGRRTSAASDVFSLGSTLLYAATGHPPYRGDTTVDVLVRLATEPPDLSGLPAELTGMLADCLDRDPAGRPTPAALLARIAATMRYEDGEGARSLPPAAVRMISDYRRRPEPVEPVDTESTLGSLPPRAVSPAPSSLPPHPSAPALSLPPDPLSLPPGPLPGARSPSGPDRRLLAALAALAAVVLIGAGILVGTVLDGGPPPAAQQAGGPQGGGPPAGPPQGPPPGDHPQTGPPTLQLNQSFGDRFTTPVVSGRGWRPGSTVTVRVQGGRTGPDRPVVDRSGSFNYTVNQHHELFAGDLPVGPLVVVVTGSDGTEKQVSFDVSP